MEFRPSASLFWDQTFALPAVIADRHLKLCGSVALKVILLIFRSPSEFCSVDALSHRLGLDKSDVTDAVNYWLEAGVLDRTEGTNAPPQKPMTAPPLQATASGPVGAACAAFATTAAAPAPKSRTRYTRDEVMTMILGDKPLHSLVGEVEAILARPLTSADLDALAALYSYYGLSAHFIVTLLHYCVFIGKKGLAYAEAVAASWIEQGVDDSTIDAHVEALKRRRSLEGRLKTAFGLDRNFVPREREYIKKWFEDYKLDYSVVLKAFENTVERTGKIAFRYMDKILESWVSQGITSVEQAENEAKPKQAAGNNSDLSRMIWDNFMED